MTQTRTSLRRAFYCLFSVALTLTMMPGESHAKSRAAAPSPEASEAGSENAKPEMREVLVMVGGRLTPALRPVTDETPGGLVVKRSKTAATEAGTQGTSESGKVAAASTADDDSSVAGHSAYDHLIAAAAKRHGVSVELAHAVIRVESNYNARARGRHGEIGLMQIKPATARGLGFRGKASALYDPATNLEWGMRYLAGAQARAGGDTCGTILRYNAGHFATRMNARSRQYCGQVKQIIASL